MSTTMMIWITQRMLVAWLNGIVDIKACGGIRVSAAVRKLKRRMYKMKR